uniref:trypsin n=1 Tax=Nyssomyia neivai TaxID=330878 RepID=A0A1L8DQF2_9DIPT
MWYQIVVLSILSLTSNAALLPAPIHRIVGGQAIDIEKVPYQVSINYKGGHECGGSILNERFIMSAAHCVVDLPSQFLVRAGSSNSIYGGETASVKAIHVHKHHNETTNDYDFAIFELNNPLTLNPTTIRPVRLPEANADIPTGTNLTVSGWGETRDPSLDEFQLRGVTVPKVDDIECIATHLFLVAVTERMFCAGYREGGKDACQGDSGGPITADNDLLVGVVSFGFGCARPRYPGVYARISSVRQWIRDIANV